MEKAPNPMNSILRVMSSRDRGKKSSKDLTKDQGDASGPSADASTVH